jgi:hypothetical protein
MPKRTDYDRGNEDAARIILADPERYDGLPLQWAKLWVARHGALKKEPTKIPPVAGRKGKTNEAGA